MKFLLHMHGTRVSVTLDTVTGAKCNVLPLSLVNKLGGNLSGMINKHKRANLIAFGGSQIVTEDVVTVKVNGLDVDFQVVNKPGVKSLFGLKACLQLGLITLTQHGLILLNCQT